MKYPFSFFLFAFSFYQCSLQNNQSASAVDALHSYSFTENVPTDDADLQFLDKLLIGKRIVLLGENSHGVGDIYALKSRLINYLYHNLGYEVIAMESGIADVYLQYQKLNTLSAKELRNTTLYSNFHCAEIMPLFELIKTSSTSSKPLIYTGFDSQNFNASFDFMSEAFIHLKAQNSRKYFDLLYKYYEIPGLISMADYAELESLEDSIQEGCSGVRLLLDSYSYELKKHYQLNDTTISYLYRAVDNLEASITLDWGLDNPYARRDSIMASNLIWLMEQVYPTKKFVVWAHNGHVDKPYAANTFMKSMGQYIMEKYGDRSYHIGIFCRKGKAYQWWQKDEIAFNNEQTDDLEQKMISQGESLRFIDVNSCSSITTYDWMNNTAFAWEPENGGRINFVPSERFDALICFDSVNPPTYDKP